MIQEGQMLVTVAQLAVIEPPPEEGPGHDKADLLQPDDNEKEAQQDEEEVQQNEEEEIKQNSVDLLEEYIDADADDEVS